MKTVLSAVDRREQQIILDWASQIPYEKHFREAHKKALEGTGKWLFEHSDFLSWHNCSSSQILWLHGSAGSGKSTLLSAKIEIAWFYRADMLTFRLDLCLSNL